MDVHGSMGLSGNSAGYGFKDITDSQIPFRQRWQQTLTVQTEETTVGLT